MNAWAIFFFAEAGASVALAGLIFVGVSLNLTRILAASQLPNRALQAVIFLGTILVVSSLMLAPDQPLIGIEITGIAIALWIFSTILDIRSWRQGDPRFRRVVINSLAVDQMVVLIQGINGLYWLVPAILYSFAKAMLDAWVLLVEINR